MHIEIDIDPGLERGGRYGAPITRQRPVVSSRAWSQVGGPRSVAEVIDVGDDGVVHLRPLKGPVADHRT